METQRFQKPCSNMKARKATEASQLEENNKAGMWRVIEMSFKVS